MSNINTTEARELFTKTTQGEWARESVFFLIKEGSFRYQREEDAEWIAYSHNNYQAMLNTIERQAKEIERQRAELGEYWRAACDIESDDDAVSAKGLADLHAIRTGNSYSQVGPSVAEMLVKQRDELAKEVERLKGMSVTEDQRKKIIAASEIFPLEDGFHRLWTDRGAISADELRVIAAELDRLNAPLASEIEAYFSDQKGGE